jgi:hypothetical protein
LNYPTISAIPPDPIPVPRTTTIHDLRSLAIERVYCQDSNEAPLKSGFTVELFLTACALRTTDEQETSLADLNCTGSHSEPLTVFIVPQSESYADADQPHKLWGFECSDRGNATFQTCLKVLMSEIRRNNVAHRQLLRTLFKITHFPPALEALHVLKEENKFEPRAVAILATCFRELALRIVPGALIDHNHDAVLQGSRQVFAWVETVTKDGVNDVDDPEASLVRTVTLRDISDDPAGQLQYVAGTRVLKFEVEAANSAYEDEQAVRPRKARLVTARTQSNSREDLRLLALAFWGRYSSIENYYVDFRDSLDDYMKHRRTPLPSLRGFEALLKSANGSKLYRIVSPKNLDEAYGTVITMSEDGFVSQYGTSQGDFKEVIKYTWNAQSGIAHLDASSGESILSKLEPIIKSRALKGTWDPDDWNYSWTETELDLAAPQEAIVICFDLSHSMASKLGYSWVGAPNSFSKLDETKQMFENVVGRMLGYQLMGNFIGVVTFSYRDQIRVTREISRIDRDEFQKMTGAMQASGLTALWDALEKSKNLLIDFKAKHPTTKLRIIAFTDGDDNRSEIKPAEICQQLYDADIVLDAIAIGDCTTTDLFKISKHTGGYAFNPTTRLLLYQTFLLEPFLDISARPDIVKVPIEDYASSLPKLPDMKTVFDFPPRRRNRLEEGSFISLSQANRFFAARSAPLNVGQNRSSIHAQRLREGRSRPVSSISSTPTLVSTPRTGSSDTASIQSNQSVSSGRVFLNELNHMLGIRDQRFADIYVNESDMSYWKVVMDGPADTSYSGGTFILTVHMTDAFPGFAPTVRFITPILHPNVTKVCHHWYRGWIIG